MPAMEVMPALAPGRGRGRRGGERNGAERGDGSGGKSKLADHDGLSWFVLDASIASDARQSRRGPGRFIRACAKPRPERASSGKMQNTPKPCRPAEWRL